jgi:hypothetical protein
MYDFMKRIIVILLACIEVAYCQPSYEVIELPLGKLEGWKRDKTTNPNATDKLPVYYVTGDYLLRIEPTNNYYTQLFDKDLKMVWETNTPLMAGSSVDFTNHAKTIYNNSKYLYQVDFGLNYGGGILKVIDLITGENKSSQFKIGTGEDNMPVALTDKSNPFFADDMMYVVASKGKKTYLSSINNSGAIATKEITLEGSSFYSESGYQSNMGGWIYADLEAKKKYLIRKLNFDYKTTNLTLETAWLSLSGSASSPTSMEIPMGKRSVMDAESFCWMENGVMNTLIVTLAKGDKSENYATVLVLNKFVDADLKATQEYIYGDQIVLDEKMLLGGALVNITHPTIVDGKFNFRVRYYKYAGAAVYWLYGQLNFSADKDLKLTYNNSPDKDAYQNTIKNMVSYNNEFVEAGAVASFFKPEYFDMSRTVHKYINDKNPMADKNCRYVGFYFNKKYILIRDDYYTVTPTVFQFSFE